MDLRDEVEATIRAWDAYEVGRGGSPVIDFDCHPVDGGVSAAGSRVEVYRRLVELRNMAEGRLRERIGADIAFLGALLGERRPLGEFVAATQGCGAAGWGEEYVAACGERARRSLDDLGVKWGPQTIAELNDIEGRIELADVPDAIRAATDADEPVVRELVGSDAPFELVIETADVDAYWAYWLDGAGHRVRLRLNLRNAVFTRAGLRRFALHEVLGHGLQSSSWTSAVERGVEWVRLMSVHAQHQILLEGLAQALPLFVAPGDRVLTGRVQVDHYIQLVRAELHLGLERGAPILELADHARRRVPWWSDGVIADALADRGADPRLRSYLWAYPAGIDWFVHLAETEATTWRNVLQAAYRSPLTPADLSALWPAGPTIGGPSPHSSHL